MMGEERSAAFGCQGAKGGNAAHQPLHHARCHAHERASQNRDKGEVALFFEGGLNERVTTQYNKAL